MRTTEPFIGPQAMPSAARPTAKESVLIPRPRAWEKANPNSGAMRSICSRSSTASKKARASSIRPVLCRRLVSSLIAPIWSELSNRGANSFTSVNCPNVISKLDCALK